MYLLCKPMSLAPLPLLLQPPSDAIAAICLALRFLIVSVRRAVGVNMHKN